MVMAQAPSVRYRVRRASVTRDPAIAVISTLSFRYAHMDIANILADTPSAAFICIL